MYPRPTLANPRDFPAANTAKPIAGGSNATRFSTWCNVNHSSVCDRVYTYADIFSAHAALSLSSTSKKLPKPANSPIRRIGAAASAAQAVPLYWREHHDQQRPVPPK